MRASTRALLPVILAVFAAAPLAAQDIPGGGTGPGTPDTVPEPSAVAEEAASVEKPITIQSIRPNDQRGINVFEAPKDNGVSFDGFRIDFGAAFTQQFQSLSHENTASPRPQTINGQP